MILSVAQADSAALESNHYVEDFVESAKDLYFEGAMRFENLCEEEMLTLSPKDQRTVLGILDKVQMKMAKELDKED